VRAVGGADVGLERTGRERLQRVAHVGRGRVVPGGKEAFNRAVFLQHAPQDQHQRQQIAAADPPVHQRLEPVLLLGGLEGTDKRRGMRPDHAEQRLDRLEHAGHASKRQARGAKPHHLAIRRVGEPADDVHRVGGRVQVIEADVQVVERRPHPHRVRGVLAQNEAIGTPDRHSGQSPAAWFSGALYSASAKLGAPDSTSASIRS